MVVEAEVETKSKSKSEVGAEAEVEVEVEVEVEAKSSLESEKVQLDSVSELDSCHSMIMIVICFVNTLKQIVSFAF